MALIDRINAAIAWAVDAYDRFIVGVFLRGPEVDEWHTTSARPCDFCLAMERLSRQIPIRPGDPFPVPNMARPLVHSSFDISFIQEPGFAHPSCRCVRVTVMRRG